MEKKNDYLDTWFPLSFIIHLLELIYNLFTPVFISVFFLSSQAMKKNRFKIYVSLLFSHLPPRPSPQLVVNSFRFVPLGANDVKTPQAANLNEKQKHKIKVNIDVQKKNEEGDATSIILNFLFKLQLLSSFFTHKIPASS
jgi:hypothetical protein